jgi:hypothetical protein
VKKEAKEKLQEEMTRGKHSTERQLEKTGRNYKQERLKEREERKNRTYNPERQIAWFTVVDRRSHVNSGPYTTCYWP